MRFPFQYPYQHFGPIPAQHTPEQTLPYQPPRFDDEDDKMSNRMVTVYYEEVLAKTEKAVKLLLPGGVTEWFPISQCEDLDDVEVDDGAGEFNCPEWLADEKGVG